MTLTNSWFKAPSVDQTVQAINDACRGRGGVYASYSCKYVSWDDSSRGHSGVGLSCWGPNITDTYLKAKDGQKLFTVRPDNWNEKLGTVSAGELAVIVGNHQAGGSLKPMTLRDVLKRMGQYGSYAGMDSSSNLSSDVLDQKVSIRFQTTFLPVNSSSLSSFGRKETIEFATEVYNYQTRFDNDPKNLILLCTSQGVAVQQDGAKTVKLFHHSVDTYKRIHRHWLEAESTSHTVGGPQNETSLEKADALTRGKATATVIGPRVLGTRFNVLMTVQIPLKQKQKPSHASPFGGTTTSFGFGLSQCAAAAHPQYAAHSTPLGAPGFGAPPKKCFGAHSELCSDQDFFHSQFHSQFNCAEGAFNGGGVGSSSLTTGMSSAARVSRGTEYDTWPGLKATHFERHESEHVTVTVVLYNVVTGGVPTEADVIAAIDDLEQLYAACSSVSRQHTTDFNAISNQPMAPTTNPPPPPPPPPPPSAVQNGTIFPSPQPPPAAPVSSPFLPKFKPFLEVPEVDMTQARDLIASMESYAYLHEQGLYRLNDTQASRDKICESFGFFRLANELKIQLVGSPDPTSLYNMACCCSRLASLRSSSPAPNVPQKWVQSSDACLDASASWLMAAVSAGWLDVAHMKVDSDLGSLRTGRTKLFCLAEQLAQYKSQI